MMLVLDASVALRWFVDQEGSVEAALWLRRFVSDSQLFVAPELLRFEVFRGLARLQPRRDPSWARVGFDRFERLGIRMIATSRRAFERAFDLSRELRIGSYDAIYLSLAEELGCSWLTADRRILRRLANDRRLHALEGTL